MNHGLPGAAVQKIHGVFTHYPQVKRVLLYGSRARGDYKRGSDIDMTICRDGAADRNLLTRIYFDLDDLLLPYMIDLSLLDEIDDPGMLEHIRRVGVPFYVRAEQAVT